MNVKSDAGLLSVCFFLPCDWSRKRASSPEPIRRKTKPHLDSFPLTLIVFLFLFRVLIG